MYLVAYITLFKKKKKTEQWVPAKEGTRWEYCETGEENARDCRVAIVIAAARTRMLGRGDMTNIWDFLQVAVVESGVELF